MFWRRRSACFAMLDSRSAQWPATWSTLWPIDSFASRGIFWLACQPPDLQTKSSLVDSAWSLTRWFDLSRPINWLDQITVDSDYPGIFNIFKYKNSRKNPKNSRKIIEGSEKLKKIIVKNKNWRLVLSIPGNPDACSNSYPWFPINLEPIQIGNFMF